MIERIKTPDPTGLQVAMSWRGQVLLGDVVGTYECRSGVTRLLVRHFCGEPWPIYPRLLAVGVLRRDWSDQGDDEEPRDQAARKLSPSCPGEKRTMDEWTRPRYVVRKNGTEELYLQRGQTWGPYETARRFRDQDAAGRVCDRMGGDHGVFPCSVALRKRPSRDPALTALAMAEMEAAIEEAARDDD